MAAGKVAVFGVPTAAGARAAGPRARRPSPCARPASCEALRDAGAARREPLRPVALPLPRRPRPPDARATPRCVACAVRATADEMTRALAEGFTRRAGRRLHAGGGHGRRRPRGRSASRSASSTSTPTPTSTRPRPRPPGFLHGMALAARPGPRPGGGGRTRAASRPRCAPEHVALRRLPRTSTPASARRWASWAWPCPRAAARAAGHARGGGPGPRRGRATTTARSSCTSTWT